MYLSNNTGLAQKGGPVEAPIVISQGDQPTFNHLFPGQVDLYLGFDLLRAAEASNLRNVAPDVSRAVVSTAQVPTAEMNRNPRQVVFPAVDGLTALIERHVRKGESVYMDTYWLAEALFADILYANMLLLGAAYQSGCIPVGADSIEQAIRLNGKAVENNIRAFRWGRLAVADPARVERELGSANTSDEQRIAEARSALAGNERGSALLEAALNGAWPASGKRALAVRIAELCDYQHATYATEYVEFVESVWERERELGLSGEFAQAVSKQLYRLMAYKDEYEVARLATAPRNVEKLKGLFAGPVELTYRLHPPSLRWLFRKKIALGGWFHGVLNVLKKGKVLRGGPFDPFGRSPGRRFERELIGWYRDVAQTALAHLCEENYSDCVHIADMAGEIRGFETVKERAAERVRKEVAQRLRALV